MTRSSKHRLAEALELPETERADLAVRLIEGLDPGADGDAEAAWDEVSRERLDQLDRGLVRGVPGTKRAEKS
jgi:hypothetical protein